MENTYSESYQVRLSQCDHRGRLSPSAALDLFMNLAGAHAERLGNGVAALRERGKFWVALKTRLELTRQPELDERVAAETWPEAAGRMLCARNYLLRAGEETLLAGRTEWTILDTEGRLCNVREVYPGGMVFRTDRAVETPFYRFARDFAEPVFAEYRVRSTDVDLVGHMNNVAYLRMLLGLYGTAELDARPLRAVELHYRNAAHEGDRLLIRRREAEGAAEYRVEQRDGGLVLLARVENGKG